MENENETLRDILVEMRESGVTYVVALAKRISMALNRDCYCPICGRILGHKPSEEWYDKTVDSDPEKCDNAANHQTKEI